MYLLFYCILYLDYSFVRFLPKVAKVLHKFANPIGAIIAVVILTLGVYVNHYVFKVSVTHARPHYLSPIGN